MCALTVLTRHHAAARACVYFYYPSVVTRAAVAALLARPALERLSLINVFLVDEASPHACRRAIKRADFVRAKEPETAGEWAGAEREEFLEYFGALRELPRT